jgi:mRNA interferase MazF
MKIEKFNIYLADLGNKFENEPGKIRPVVVVQSDLLNRENHTTTIVCPVTSRINLNLTIIRVHLGIKGTGLNTASDVLIDQVRAIDNKRFKKHLGKLNSNDSQRVLENLSILIRE